MNWQHLRAFVWLRWRLMMNQWRRAGAFNGVLLMIVSIAALVTVVPLFVASFILGLYAIPDAKPAHLMYAWDGVLAAFLFFWTVGLVAELQRTEPLSLSKFMHLPVSINGAFLINYLSSLMRLSLLFFGPVMLGFCLALIYVKGILLLLVLPLLAAFLLMVTAVTYQFQGWLATLMSNPRRRRTVIVTTTLGFVLICQLPNLLNVYAPWAPQRRADQSRILVEELAKLDRGFRANEFDAIEHLRRQQQIMEKHQLAQKQANREMADQWGRGARLVNMVLPVGWLPLGVMSAAERNLIPSILGLLGMTVIGTLSIALAYRTTIGHYAGQSTNRKGRPKPAIALLAGARKAGTLLVEARIPGVSEPVSAIALGGLRALVRSPEAKMMMLTPLIMGIVFGSVLIRGGHNLPELTRPLVAIGGMVSVLLGVLQLAGNQFGFDRDGFRVFVLCAARRRDILFGKNLAFAPVALGMGAIVLATVQVVCPMRLDHFLAMFPQYVSMFLLFCFFTNFFSIYAPVYIAAGSLKPSNPKLTTVLVQLLMFMLIFPLTQGVTLLPLGIEAILNGLGWGQGAPICLALSLVQIAVVAVFYRFSLDWQGDLLQAREQSILEVVTQRAP